jgi:flagellar assembly protein FliH
LSKIIKAAQLQILVPSSQDQIFRPEAEIDNVKVKESQKADCTIFQATQLIDDANAKAAAIIEAAQAKANEIVSKAEAEKARIESELDAVISKAQQDGFAEGYHKGRETGYQEIQQKAAQFLDSMAAIAESAAEQRSAALAKLEEDYLKLSLYIAEKIIKKEIASDPTLLLPSIKAGLERLSGCEQVIIRVSPQTCQVLKDAASLADVFNGKIRWESDPALRDGDCLLETEYGAIDAGFEQRFAKLSTELQEQIYAK